LGDADLEWFDDGVNAGYAKRSGAAPRAREMDFGNADRIAVADHRRQRSAAGVSGSQPRQEGGAGIFDDDCVEGHSHASRDTGAWIIGHDGKARRIEPSIQLLADGVPSRVGRLRAFGNAIDPILASEVIGAFMDCTP
jgi:DNA (cytosine-5)-methyltransferase 1